MTSFGFRHGVPPDCDFVFDVRFLPNELHSEVQEADGEESGGGTIHPVVSADARIHRESDGSAGVAAAALHPRGEELPDDRVGCTGGTGGRRSVMIAESAKKNLATAEYQAKVTHRDLAKPV